MQRCPAAARICLTDGRFARTAIPRNRPSSPRGPRTAEIPRPPGDRHEACIPRNPCRFFGIFTLSAASAARAGALDDILKAKVIKVAVPQDFAPSDDNPLYRA
jgi:hypothetical protein